MRSLTHWNRLNSRISAAPRTFLSPPSKKPKKFICQQNLKSGGERSNAAARTAVCRRATVTRAPRSRARLLPVTTRRRPVAQPRTLHLHCAARAVLQAQSLQCRGSRGTPLAFLWGFQRGYSLRKENTPLIGSSAKSCTINAAPAALQPPPSPSMGWKSKNAHCTAHPLHAMMRPS